MKQIISALVEAQKAIKHAGKDAKNPHFRNDYATLESVIDAVKESANKNGIFITQTQGRDDHGIYLDTQLMHVSGEVLPPSRMYLSLDKPGMQALGSALTYSRRYSLAAIFCISQVDDDANGSSAFVSGLESHHQKQTTNPQGSQNVSRQPVQSAASQQPSQPVRFGNPRA